MNIFLLMHVTIRIYSSDFLNMSIGVIHIICMYLLVIAVYFTTLQYLSVVLSLYGN